MDNSKYYGGRDIHGRLITTEETVSLFQPESILIIDDIESEYRALIKALDGKVVTP